MKADASMMSANGQCSSSRDRGAVGAEESRVCTRKGSAVGEESVRCCTENEETGLVMMACVELDLDHQYSYKEVTHRLVAIQDEPIQAKMPSDILSEV